MSGWLVLGVYVACCVVGALLGAVAALTLARDYNFWLLFYMPVGAVAGGCAGLGILLFAGGWIW